MNAVIESIENEIMNEIIEKIEMREGEIPASSFYRIGAYLASGGFCDSSDEEEEEEEETCDTCGKECEWGNCNWCDKCRKANICKCEVCNENKPYWKYDENKQFCEDCDSSDEEEEEEDGELQTESTCCCVCESNVPAGGRLYAGGEHSDYCMCKSCWERPQCSCVNSCYLEEGKTLCAYCLQK